MGLSGAGSSTGIVFIVYNLGQIAAFPFCGLLADGYGRRICIFVGCVLVLVGTAIQGSAHGLDQFVGGRFVLGFGASIASAAGPAYTVELAHPAYRGFMAGMVSTPIYPTSMTLNILLQNADHERAVVQQLLVAGQHLGWLDDIWFQLAPR